MWITSDCKTCGQSFFYPRGGVHSRPRQYCDTCKPLHDAQLNRDRVAKHRKAQREAQTSPNKRTRSEATRPVRGGKSTPTIPQVKSPKGNGLYAGEPEPTRTQKRRKVGLPTDAK